MKARAVGLAHAAIDYYKAASVLLKTHGLERALAICDKQEVAMLRASDVEGHAAWKTIRAALVELVNKTPPAGEKPN